MTSVESCLTQRDLEARWKISGRTLERWRAELYGPAWVTLGGSIRYRLDDIERFEAQHRHGDAAIRKDQDGGEA